MKLLVMLLLLVLATSSALAGSGMTIMAVGDAPDKSYQGEESFEFAMPPAGWYRTVTNAGATWSQFFHDPYDGNQTAYLPMDIMGEAVDERLGFTTTYTSTQWLHFALKGQVCVNATLEVRVGGELVFDFARDWTLPYDQWGLVEIDLGQTSSAGVPNVDFSWRYVGTFGAEMYMDLVGLTETPIAAEDTDWSAVKRMFR